MRLVRPLVRLLVALSCFAAVLARQPRVAALVFSLRMRGVPVRAATYPWARAIPRRGRQALCRFIRVHRPRAVVVIFVSLLELVRQARVDLCPSPPEHPQARRQADPWMCPVVKEPMGRADL